MMEIYFDDVLINEDYYTALSTSFALFSDTFYLGSTATNTYNVSIAKEAVSKQPNIVTVKDNGVLIATLVVDKIEENDFEYKYTLTDKMVNLEFAYDASKIFTNGSATLLEIAQDICNKAGVTLATTNFRSYDKKISWYDNTRTARKYIEFIAELNGGYAQIGKDGKLYFLKQKTSSVKTINFDDCEDFKIGEKHKITRVVYELGALKYEYGDETGNTLYLNGENVYITEQSEVEAIYNEIKGFEFYSFSTGNCPIDYKIMAGQVISFTDGTNKYPTIVGYNLTYNGGWYGGYELNVATKKQEETQVVGTDKKIKNLSIKVDRDKNEIITKIESVEGQVTDITTTQATQEGTTIKIEDSAEEPILELELDGKSTQATRSGKNKLENIGKSQTINGLTFTVNEDGTVIVNGTATAQTAFIVNSFLVLPVGQYIFSGCPTSGTTQTHFVQIRRRSPDSYINDVGQENTFSIEDNTQSVDYYIVVRNGITVNNVLFKPMIRLASISDDTYEPYGASPTPEFPSEIKSVGDDVNLFDKNNANYLDGYIDTNSIVSNLNYKTYYMPCLPNTTYTISRVGTSTIYVAEKSLLPTLGGSITNKVQGTSNSVTITTTSTATYLVFQVYRNNYDNLETVLNTLKLQKGTVATSYSEYGKGTVTIEQRGKNLLKGLSTSLTDSEYWFDVNKYYFTPLEDGWGKFEYDNTNGTGTIFINAKVKQSAVKLKPNSTYTIITEIRNSSISENSGAFFQLITNNATTSSSENKNLNYTQINAGGIYRALIQTKESFSGVNIAIDTYLRLAKGTKGTVEARISLVEGDIDITDFDYEPYFSKDYVIPTTPLRSLPNGTKDTIEEDGIHRLIGNYVCNGTETVTINNQYVNTFRIENIPNAYTESNNVLNGALCSHFKEKVQSKVSSGTIGFAMLGGNINKVYICFGADSEINTVEKVKQWLTEQYAQGTPLIFQYELAEEVVEPFTDEQLEVIKSIETNLYTQYFNCDANMRITYVRNNGLADMYETKDSANRNYTETEQKMSELNISLEGITQEVSNVKTDLSDNYATTIETKSLIKQTADSINSEVSKKIGEQNNKISQVTQTVDELNSKISDIADITTSQESINGKVNLEKINQSEPIYVKIYPRAENISYLYPHSNLYPNETLYLKTRTLRFTNTTNNTYVDYELPDNLLYYDAENYDEFILDYDAQSCVINKKVGYNADGTTYLLENPTTIEYEYPKIELEDGDYTVELLGYTDAYLFVRLMAQNIYTTQFATRAEVNSEISQKADEVNISVDKKLSNYSTTTQMNSAINVKANEITSNVSTTYATKGELNTAKSEIKQTTDSITSTVSKKVGNDEIISKINQSAEAVGINANKIELSATDILNLLAGNTINLSSKNIIISSNVFNVASNGKVIIKGTNQATDLLRIENINGSDFAYYAPDSWGIVRNNGSIYATAQGGNFANSNIELNGTNGTTNVRNTGITTPSLIQTSLYKDKKNFEIYTESALSKIKDIDIYKYNLKSEDDTDKKHIGFVIGDNYKYSKEVTSTDNQGVDNYSFTSLCCKAIQELAEQNEQLQKEIQELKGEK